MPQSLQFERGAKQREQKSDQHQAASRHQPDIRVRLELGSPGFQVSKCSVQRHAVCAFFGLSNIALGAVRQEANTQGLGNLHDDYPDIAPVDCLTTSPVG